MGIGPCVGDFVRTGFTGSHSKLWFALPGRHSSPPRSSTAADNDVPPARGGWPPHVVRDSHSGSFVETTISKPQALLCNCRDPNRGGVHVQPGLADAATSLEDHRLCLGLQPRLDGRAGRRQTGALWSSGPGSLVEEIAFPAASSSHDTWARSSALS